MEKRRKYCNCNRRSKKSYTRNKNSNRRQNNNFFNKNGDINKIFKLDALGKVKFVNGKQIANGDKATFFIDNERIIIKGNVKLEREDSFMIGEELSIDLKNDSTKLISSEKSGKVKAKYKTEDNLIVVKK